jgi:alkylation response protein AidB-like acyl-CoA dehydrogenase
MKFALTPEQSLLQDQVGRLLADHCAHERLQAQINGEADHDAALWAALVEMGLCALLVPEEFDGAGLTLVEAALAAEMLGRAGAAAPLFGQWLATLAIGLSEDAALKAEWLPHLAMGERRATVALGEGEGRWAPDQWTARLVDGTLTGAAAYVPNAAGADAFVVGVEGGGLALVPAGPQVQIQPLEGVDRTRRLYQVRFEAAPAHRIGGAPSARRVLDAALALIAADGFGGASRALEMTLDYVKQREQFGSVIGRFQAVKHQLANVALSVEPTRALYWYAAFAQDHRPDDAARAAALAKAHICDVALQAARDCVELHGGVGYTWEYDLHVWLKRAMANYAWGGAPEVHRLAYAEAAGW